MTPEPELAPEDSAASLARHTGVMSVGTALSRLTGFLRLAAMTYALGITAGRLSDAYNTANTTPNIVYELVLGGVLSSVFVPVFVEWMQTRGREEAWEVARRVFTITVVALAVVMLAGIVAAPWIIRLYTVRVPGPEREAAVELATFFLRIFMPQIVFYGLGTIATGLLNANRRFAAPMFAPLLNNLIVVATFLAYARMAGAGRTAVAGLSLADKVVLSVGTTLGVVVMTVALWPSLRRTGFRFRWRLDRGHEAVRRIARLATWTVVYVVVNQLGYLIVPVLALGERGSYAAYVSAFILFQLPHAIFAVSIFTALLPSMAGRWANDDAAGFRALLSRGIRATGFVVIPAALGYVALAVPIVRLLLQHGETGPRDTQLIAGILTFFALGLFSFSAFQLLLRAFYAMQDTRTPALVNIGAVALNVVANVVYFFVLDLGVKGLALGHATAYTFGALALGLILRRRLGGLDGRRIAASLARVVPAAAATAGVAWLAARLIGDALGTATLGAQAIQVLGSILLGLLVFALSALILRIEETDVLKGAMTARFRR